MSKSTHYSPLIGVIRGYNFGKSYQDRDDYSGVVNVVWLSDTHVRLTAALGSFSTKQLKEAMIDLKERGVMLIDLERVNGRMVPWGEMIEVSEKVTLWRIDLSKVCL